MRIWKWCKRLGLGFLTLLAILLVGGASYQFVQTKLDERAYPPSGQMVDVGGYRLHLQSMGSGGPTVVLDAGMGNIGLDWGLVQPEIAKFTRVVSYDRAGNGWSERGLGPRTSLQIVQELHTLLHKAQIPGPYIIVGHSFGGANAQLFAAVYPEEVAGIVLVDACHEEQEKRLPASPISDGGFGNTTIARLSTTFGITRLLMAMQTIDPPMPLELWDAHLALCLTTKHWNSMLDESSDFNESLAQLAQADRAVLAKIPCIVITAGRMPDLAHFGLNDSLQAYFQEMFVIWGDLQRELVAKFNDGHQIIADKSDHMIPWHQSELIVHAVQMLATSFLSHGEA